MLINHVLLFQFADLFFMLEWSLLISFSQVLNFRLQAHVFCFETLELFFELIDFIFIYFLDVLEAAWIFLFCQFSQSGVEKFVSLVEQSILFLHLYFEPGVLFIYFLIFLLSLWNLLQAALYLLVHSFLHVFQLRVFLGNCAFQWLLFDINL